MDVDKILRESSLLYRNLFRDSDEEKKSGYLSLVEGREITSKNIHVPRISFVGFKDCKFKNCNFYFY